MEIELLDGYNGKKKEGGTWIGAESGRIISRDVAPTGN